LTFTDGVRQSVGYEKLEKLAVLTCASRPVIWAGGPGSPPAARGGRPALDEARRIRTKTLLGARRLR